METPNEYVEENQRLQNLAKEARENIERLGEEIRRLRAEVQSLNEQFAEVRREKQCRALTPAALHVPQDTPSSLSR